MEIPDLVREQLGDEEIHAGVNIGDEDALLVTDTRTIIYSGEGLLSDERVDVYPHDVERLAVSDGRRKTKFTLDYVDGTESFTVPGKRADTVLELLVEGVLRVAGVSEADESVQGVFRFSELTVIITDNRLVKHVGAPIWDDDFEEFPFAAVTGLEFEEGSVATQIVMWVEERPQRIKAPNDQAGLVRQTLEDALFGYHGVRSLEELNETVGPEDGAGGDSEAADTSSADTTASSGGDLGLNDEIAPLVGDESGEDDAGGEPAESEPEESGARPSSIEIDPTSAAEESREGSLDDAPEPEETTETGGSESADGGGTEPTQSGSDAVSREELEELAAEVRRLQETVEDQGQVLRKQHEAIKQLVSELRQER